MIIAVGFKVNNPRAVQFRKWAGQIVKDHTIQGWTMDKERLKKGHMFTDEYFERQLQYIREIRLSERKFLSKDHGPLRYSFRLRQGCKDHPSVFPDCAEQAALCRSSPHSGRADRSGLDAAKEHMKLATWENAPDGKIVKV